MVTAKLEDRPDICAREVEGLRAFTIAKLDDLRLLKVIKWIVDRARQL